MVFWIGVNVGLAATNLMTIGLGPVSRAWAWIALVINLSVIALAASQL